MAFNKFDPRAPEPGEDADTLSRRAWLLKWGWWISTGYTLFGFLMIGYFLFWR